MKNVKSESNKQHGYCSASLTLLTARHWLLLITSVFIAAACLIGIPYLINGKIAQALAILLFTAMPIATFAFVSQDKGRSLFRPLTVRSLFQALGFGVLTFAIAIITALILAKFIETSSNPGLHNLHNLSTGEIIIFFLFSIPQLFGEEMITIIPFLGIYCLCKHYFHLSHRLSVFISLFLSCIWFSIIHLPTYNWNFIQVLGGVGIVRIVLTLAFIVTRNLWISFGAHVINDWIMFALSLLDTSEQ